MNISIRESKLSDAHLFIASMQKSKHLHTPWVNPPLTLDDYENFLARFEQANAKSYLVLVDDIHIAGIFNISEIVLACFQSAYLGFYATQDFAGKGVMSIGFKLVLKEIFTSLNLHRIEANIQPENQKSIRLVEANGFKQEGYSPRYLKINHEWRDHIRFALTFEDWSELHANHQS